MVSRRELLAGASATTAVAAWGRLAAPADVLAAPASWSVFRSGYPRTFAFRQAEFEANARPFSEWEALFLPLHGVAGKLLQEERTDTVTARNLEYFDLWKRRHPGKLALLHLNGRGRLPGFETDDLYGGGGVSVDPALLAGLAGTSVAFARKTAPAGPYLQVTSTLPPGDRPRSPSRCRP